MLVNPYVYGSGSASDPHFANVVALLHFDGLNGSSTFTDVKGKTWTPSSADPVISTVQSKFGGSSLRLDGTGDFLDCTHADFNFGTGDFTVEMWARLNAAADFMLVETRFGGASHSYCLYDSNGGGGNEVMTLYANSANRATSGALSAGVWYHVAISRASGSTRFFLDGVQQGSTYADANNYSSTQFRLGHNFTATSSSASGFNGWIDELRITKGVGRYTANFTPPTAAFPDS